MTTCIESQSWEAEPFTWNIKDEANNSRGGEAHGTALPAAQASRHPAAPASPASAAHPRAKHSKAGRDAAHLLGAALQMGGGLVDGGVHAR